MLSFLCHAAADKFTDAPDLVEDFFDFATRFCRHCPSLLLQQHPELLAAICACGEPTNEQLHESSACPLRRRRCQA